MRLRFPDGNLQWVAVDRLHLIGTSRAEKRRWIVEQKERWAKAIEQETGIDARSVPIRGMSSRGFEKRRGPRGVAAGEYIPNEHRILLNRSEPDPDLNGVHELVHGGLLRHAITQNNAYWAVANFNEGLAQYYATRVLTRHLGYSEPPRNHPYYPYYRFVVRLAELVTPEKIDQFALTSDRTEAHRVFTHEIRPLVAEKVKYRPNDWSPDALKVAMDHLEKNDIQAALAVLDGPPTTDNPWRVSSAGPTLIDP